MYLSYNSAIYNLPHHQPHKTFDDGAPGLTANVLISCRQKPPGQFRPSILHRNRQPDARTFFGERKRGRAARWTYFLAETRPRRRGAAGEDVAMGRRGRDRRPPPVVPRTPAPAPASAAPSCGPRGQTGRLPRRVSAPRRVRVVRGETWQPKSQTNMSPALSF